MKNNIFNTEFDYFRGDLLTEESNERSHNLDKMSTSELAEIFSKEDIEPQRAVAKSLPDIVNAIESILLRVKSGGRLIYIGAGTSGRLGVLDASECPPTFCTPPDLIQGIIAGGDSALKNSSEDLEDLDEIAIKDLQSIEFHCNDSLIGITAGGTTPYVISALNYAKELGALSISIACVPIHQIQLDSDIDIRLLTGPELLTGSTRLKAGTATKMTLNMISTILMIRLGKVYGNKMVDLSVSNKKLADRALRILIEIANVDRKEGERLLKVADGSVKIALLMSLCSLDLKHAKDLLSQNDDNLRSALIQAN